MAADAVAGHVLVAVIASRFWILTHDAYRSVIVAHAEWVGTAARPVPAPIWQPTRPTPRPRTSPLLAREGAACAADARRGWSRLGESNSRPAHYE